MIFREGDRFTLDQIDYFLVYQDQVEVGLVRSIGGGPHQIFTYTQLEQLMIVGRMSIRSSALRSTALNGLDAAPTLFADLKPKAQAKVLWKELFCRAFLELYEANDANGRRLVLKTDPSIKAMLPKIIERVTGYINGDDLADIELTQALRKEQRNETANFNDLPPPGPHTLRIWVAEFEDGLRKTNGLISNQHRSGNHKPRRCWEAEKLLRACAESFAYTKSRNKSKTIRAGIERFRVENKDRIRRGLSQLTVPDARTFRRYINALPPFWLAAKKFGLPYAKAKFNIYGVGIPVCDVGERIEIGEWKTDLFTIAQTSAVLEALSPAQLRELDTKENRRLWLYVIIDCATRIVLSIHLCGSPTGNNAVLALSRAYKDKTLFAKAAGCRSTWHQKTGIMSIFPDQGVAFRSIRFRSCVADLEASLEFGPGGNPQLRGRMERLFGTFSQQIIPDLSGAIPPDWKDKDHDDPQADAALTDDDLAKIIIRYIVDAYHHEPQEGLNGETPFECWERLTSKTGYQRMPGRLDILVATGLRGTRDASGRGIDVNRTPYACPELFQFYKDSPDKTVEFAMDPEDIGHIAVKLGTSWYFAKSQIPDLDGMSAADWLEALSVFKDRSGPKEEIRLDQIREVYEEVTKINAAARKLKGFTDRRTTEHDISRLNEETLLGVDIEYLSNAEDLSRDQLDLFAHSFSVRAVAEANHASDRPGAVTGVQDSADIPPIDIVIEED
jgi:putative transposase